MFYYLEACATLSNSFFFFTEGAAGSLFAANIKCDLLLLAWAQLTDIDIFDLVFE